MWGTASISLVPEDALVDRTLRSLRSAGGRITKPREQIVRTLIGGSGHLSAEELAERVHQSNPSIHITTVYRTLDALERLGVVNHVHLGHGRAIYHLANDAHYHLYCQECGKIEEVPPSLFAGVDRKITQEWGFKTVLSHFAFIGFCRSCQESGLAGGGEPLAGPASAGG